MLYITTIFFTSLIVINLEKNLDLTKPCYSGHILPVLWPFVIEVSSTEPQFYFYLQRKETYTAT